MSYAGPTPSGEIRSRPCPRCACCGRFGDPLYAGLCDRLFDAPGEWNLERCPGPTCELMWLDPMPVAEDIGKAYKNYFTHHRQSGEPIDENATLYRRMLHAIEAAYLADRYSYGVQTAGLVRKILAVPNYLYGQRRARIEFPLKYLLREPRGRMVEVGFGSGERLKLAQEIGWQAEGVEVDLEAVANAIKAGLSAYTGQLADQGFPDSYCEMVLMSHVIEHVHDPLALLSECRRLVTEAGTVIVSTPNAQSWGHRIFRRDWVNLDPPRHLYVFSPGNLTKLAKAAGFSRVQISTSIRMTPFTFVFSRSIRKSGRAAPLTPASRTEHLYGISSALAEQAIIRWRPMIGEEVLMEARR